jgi:hypothetical protein
MHYVKAADWSEVEDHVGASRETPEALLKQLHFEVEAEPLLKQEMGLSSPVDLEPGIVEIEWFQENLGVASAPLHYSLVYTNGQDFPFVVHFKLNKADIKTGEIPLNMCGRKFIYSYVKVTATFTYMLGE